MDTTSRKSAGTGVKPRPGRALSIHAVFCTLALAAAAFMACSARAAGAPAGPITPHVFHAPMKIEIEVNGTLLAATLENSAAARDFAALLPLKLTLKDYAATEKIADLPRKLSTKEAPAGIDPDVGDITYYAPWGNLAIFYKDFGYAAGLVKLGRTEGSMSALQGPAPLPVTIRRAAE